MRIGPGGDGTDPAGGRQETVNWAELFLFILIGFAAQIIDGTLGMAYGVSCRTFLKTVAGLPTALASAVVHVAEVPTTLVSGLSHLRLRNVDRSLLWRLMLPGVVGGVLGAWFLTSIGDQLEPVYRPVSGGHGRNYSPKSFPAGADAAPEGGPLHLPSGHGRRVPWTPPAAADGGLWSPPPWWPPATT